MIEKLISCESGDTIRSFTGKLWQTVIYKPSVLINEIVFTVVTCFNYIVNLFILRAPYYYSVLCSMIEGRLDMAVRFESVDIKLINIWVETMLWHTRTLINYVCCFVRHWFCKKKKKNNNSPAACSIKNMGCLKLLLIRIFIIIHNLLAISFFICWLFSSRKIWEREKERERILINKCLI